MLPQAPAEALANTSFSTTTPQLQLAWDSTSLGLFKTCPRKYQLSIVEGWQPRGTSVHLTFGIHYHAALETYDHAKFAGASHELATIAAVRRAMADTWDQDLNRPWVSDDKNKNRFTLVRSVVWYLDQFGASDNLHTVALANGRPAVELSFRMETSYRSSDGEPFLLCGHLDRVATLYNHAYIVDRKTSKHQLDERYFDQFSPHNQFTIYSLAGKVVYQLPIQGIICDAAQVAVTFSRFQRQPIPRSQEILDEWYHELGGWLAQAESYARDNYWPMNDTSCDKFFGCEFRPICRRHPSVREQWLRADYVRRVWDPLKTREI